MKKSIYHNTVLLLSFIVLGIFLPHSHPAYAIDFPSTIWSQKLPNGAETPRLSLTPKSRFVKIEISVSKLKLFAKNHFTTFRDTKNGKIIFEEKSSIDPYRNYFIPNTNEYVSFDQDETDFIVQYTNLDHFPIAQKQYRLKTNGVIPEVLTSDDKLFLMVMPMNLETNFIISTQDLTQIQSFPNAINEFKLKNYKLSNTHTFLTYCNSDTNHCRLQIIALHEPETSQIFNFPFQISEPTLKGDYLIVENVSKDHSHSFKRKIYFKTPKQSQYVLLKVNPNLEIALITQASPHGRYFFYKNNADTNEWYCFDTSISDIIYSIPSEPGQNKILFSPEQKYFILRGAYQAPAKIIKTATGEFINTTSLNTNDFRFYDDHSIFLNPPNRDTAVYLFDDLPVARFSIESQKIKELPSRLLEELKIENYPDYQTVFHANSAWVTSKGRLVAYQMNDFNQFFDSYSYAKNAKIIDTDKMLGHVLIELSNGHFNKGYLIYDPHTQSVLYQNWNQNYKGAMIVEGKNSLIMTHDHKLEYVKYFQDYLY